MTERRIETVQMPCARCSSPLSSGDQYCPRCGARVSLIAQPRPDIPPPDAHTGQPPRVAGAGPSAARLLAERLAALSSLPRNELAALALTGLGGALALVSYCLPWANDVGLAIGTMGTTGSPPQPGAWAFDTPAGWPLFLVTALLLACVAAGDRAQALMPGLAATIRPLTGIVAPLALGSGSVAVALMYLTLPWGCGSGPVVLGLAGCLLIAGSLVALLRPSPQPAADKPV
jgi:hypothetical protein